jgi:ribosomal protein S25
MTIAAKTLLCQQKQHTLRNLSLIEKRVLNKLFFYDTIYETMHMTQQHIADKCGISLSHCHRIIKMLHATGLIFKTWRGVRRTCHYRIPDFFYDEVVRFAFDREFPALKIIALKMRDSWKLISSLFNDINCQTVLERTSSKILRDTSTGSDIYPDTMSDNVHHTCYSECSVCHLYTNDPNLDLFIYPDFSTLDTLGMI